MKFNPEIDCVELPIVAGGTILINILQISFIDAQDGYCVIGLNSGAVFNIDSTYKKVTDEILLK